MDLQRVKNLVVYYATLSDEPCNETIFSSDAQDSLNVSPELSLTLSPEVEEKFRKKCAAEFDVWEMGQA